MGVDEEKLEQFLEEMEIRGEGVEEAGAPYIDRTYVNTVIDLEDVDDSLYLTRGDLTVDGKVLLSGEASDDVYRVSLVEVSVDGGMTWEAAVGTDRWSYRFVPEEGWEYELLFRAKNDRGVYCDPCDFGGPWVVTYRDVDAEEIAKDFLENFSRCFETMDATCLEEYISDDYDGHIDDDYSKDEMIDEIENGSFEEAFSIDVEYTINQVMETQDSIIVTVRWIHVETYDYGDMYDEYIIKFWLSKTDNHRLVHGEDTLIYSSGHPGELDVTYFVNGSFSPPCDRWVRILLTVPDVPDTVNTVFVDIETSCGISSIPLSRTFYEGYTGMDDGFGDEVPFEDVPACTAPGCGGAWRMYSGAIHKALDVQYQDYGYDLLQTIMLP
jgi:hypothetical protein